MQELVNLIILQVVILAFGVGACGYVIIKDMFESED